MLCCGKNKNTHLHRHETVIDKYFLGEKVGTNSGLVLVGELFVHILVHERSLANTRVVHEYEKKGGTTCHLDGLPAIAENNNLVVAQ